MRVIDEDRERLALVDGLHAAGHALQGADAGGDRVVGHVEQAGACDRRQNVLDVEGSEERRAQLETADAESCAPGGQLELLRRDRPPLATVRT